MSRKSKLVYQISFVITLALSIHINFPIYILLDFKLLVIYLLVTPLFISIPIFLMFDTFEYIVDYIKKD